MTTQHKGYIKKFTNEERFEKFDKLIKMFIEQYKECSENSYIYKVYIDGMLHDIKLPEIIYYYINPYDVCTLNFKKIIVITNKDYLDEDDDFSKDFKDFENKVNKEIEVDIKNYNSDLFERKEALKEMNSIIKTLDINIEFLNRKYNKKEIEQLEKKEDEIFKSQIELEKKLKEKKEEFVKNELPAIRSKIKSELIELVKDMKDNEEINFLEDELYDGVIVSVENIRSWDIKESLYCYDLRTDSYRYLTINELQAI